MPDIAALDRLKSQLLTTGLQERNFALYQVINQLIDFLRQTVNLASTSGGNGVVGADGAPGANAVSFMYGYDGEDGVDGQPGLPGPAGVGTTGPPGPPGSSGMDGNDGEDGNDSFIPGPTGATGPAGTSFTLTDFTKDLGAAERSGTFDITGLAGLTIGKNVQIVQTAQPIASKGNATDEFEMDAIILTGYVLDAATIRAYWYADSVVVGTYAFAYTVSV